MVKTPTVRLTAAPARPREAGPLGPSFGDAAADDVSGANYRYEKPGTSVVEAVGDCRCDQNRRDQDDHRPNSVVSGAHFVLSCARG